MKLLALLRHPQEQIPMEPERLAIFNETEKAALKEELQLRGLDPELWRQHLDHAAKVCFAYAEALRMIEDYATDTIETLEETAEELQFCQFNDVVIGSISTCEKTSSEKLFDEIAKATKVVMVSC
jgi:hypothetical protein